MLLLMILIISCETRDKNEELAFKIQQNKDFEIVKKRAREVIATGFNAGDGYGEVWIRDYNTFIELACEVYPAEEIEENLLVFFRLQGNDGNIVDGFIPKTKAVQTEGGYQYIYSDLEPVYCGHKNTVETDHESSLVQAVFKYVQKTGNRDFLEKEVGGLTVAERMGLSMDFLMKHRWSEKHNLIYGATTADWGDVQHQHPWGVYITDETQFCVDIYDNAMFLIALDNLMELVPSYQSKWAPVHDMISKNTMKKKINILPSTW